MTVEKRDGRVKEFDISKTYKAIKKAAKATKTSIDEDSMDKMCTYISNQVKKFEEPIKVDEIQDVVENALMKYNFFDIERAYHDYRNQRDKERFKRFEIIKEMNEKLNASKVVNQNANVDEYSFGGKKGEMDSAYLKELALKYYINPKFSKNHINNRVYIHDLDSYALGMHNCLSLPFDKLLSEGVHTRQTNIRPAGSVSTAFQLCAVYMQIQSLQQFGGVAGTHIDWTMVPYVRKSFMKHFKDGLKYVERVKDDDLPKLIKRAFNDRDVIDISIEDESYKQFSFAWNYALDMTKKEINQACEGMLHNLNSLQSRSGNQLPFSSINYGTCTLLEGRLIIQSILESTIKGTGNGQTSIFPCQIFQLKDGVNTKECDPNYDLFKLAIKCTAKRMYPNYANCDWSGNDDTKSYEVKQAYIDGLSESEKEKLLNSLSTNKNLQNLFGLNIEDQNIVPKTDDKRALFSTMGCRTMSSFDINWESQWKSALDDYIKNDVVPNDMLCTGQLKDGRGNIAPATIILPTLAMEAKKKASKNNEDAYIVDYFMDILEKAIEDCKDHLIERFNWICAQDPKSASFMYINRTFTSYDKDYEKEGIRGALKHGTLAIGQLGLYETLQILIGCGHDTQKGMELAKKIEQLFKTRCEQFKYEYHQSDIREDDIVNEMISQISTKENRKLTDEEIKEIQKFCKNHK